MSFNTDSSSLEILLSSFLEKQMSFFWRELGSTLKKLIITIDMRAAKMDILVDTWD